MSLRILVMPDAISLAHVARTLRIARTCRDHGHHVRVASAEPYRDLFTAAGFDVFPLFSVPPRAALDAIRAGRILYTGDVLERYVASDLDALRAHETDLVVGDLRLSLDISAELAAVPCVSLLNAYWTRYYAPRIPPFETFPPLRWPCAALSRALMPHLIPRILRHFAQVFNRLRSRRGLAPRRDLFDVMASPYLTLLADLPAFAPCTALPDTFRYVGPVLWEPELPPPHWLNDLDPDRKTVYVTMGSTGTQATFLRVLKELSAANLQVLTTTCGQLSPPDVPPGCFAAPMAPAHELLNRSAVTVCHGGNGTVYQSLSHGVPVVGIPTFIDQELNMDRVAALGVGVRLAHHDLTGHKLVQAVMQLIGDPAWAERAAALASEIRKWNAPEEAVWNIERRFAAGQLHDAADMRRPVGIAHHPPEPTS